MSRLIDFRSWYVWCLVFMSLGCALFFLIHLSSWVNEKTYQGVSLTVLLLFLFVGVLLLIYSKHFGLFYSIGKDKEGRKVVVNFSPSCTRGNQDSGSETGSRVHVLDINDLPDLDPEFAPPPAYDDETVDIAPPPYSYAICDETGTGTGENRTGENRTVRTEIQS